MRDYAKVSSRIWTGETGKALRGHPEAQIVRDYLLTSPHSNMLGLYYLPELYIAHETGLPSEGASKGLRRVVEVGFASYDPLEEVVWVYNMAAWQVLADGQVSMSPKDNRVKGVNKAYAGLPKCMFLGSFFDRYASVFHLENRRPDSTESASPSEAPSKALRSQEQEQEQEQEKDPLSEDRGGAGGGSHSPSLTRGNGAAAPAPVLSLESPPADSKARKRFKPPTVDEVRAYCDERGNDVDPQRWHDHYTANGWKVGKNPMKDWRAAVRTWEGKNGRHAPAAPRQKSLSAPERVEAAIAERDAGRRGRIFDAG